MMIADEISYENFETAILCALLEATDNQGGGAFSLRHLAGAKDFFFEPEWIDEAAQQLSRKGYIALSRILNDEDIVTITQRGREAVRDVLFPRSSEKLQTERFASMPASSYRDKLITFEQFSELMLIALYDRFSDGFNEIGDHIEDVQNYPYCLRIVANDEGLKYPLEWLQRVVSDFHHSDWIEHQGVNDDGDDIALLNAGGFSAAELLVEKYYGTPETVPTWKFPDTPKRLNVKSVELAKLRVADAMHVITTSQFTQEEKAQILGLLKICEQILDLPTQKVGLLRKVVDMLLGIKEIAGIIKAVKDVIS